jgi:TPR repeat protein
VSTNTAPPTENEALAMLNSGQYAELNRRFSAIQLDYKSGAITDEGLRAAFRAFYPTDAALEQRYDAWVSRYPKSYVARLARGIYYKKVAEERRGGAYINSTTDEQIRGMIIYFDKASQDLYGSVALDDKPLLSYLHAMDIAAFLGHDGENRKLLDVEIRLDPRNFVAREKYMNFLEPRWGGSVEEMYAFLDECKRAGLTSAQIRSLQGLIVADEAASYKEAGDYATAERKYREAESMGHTACLPCLADVLVQENKFEDAISVYSKLLLSSPHDASNLASRAFAYMQAGKPREALADWTVAAGYGDAYSQNQLGILNMRGVPGILPPDPQAGIDWFRKAAAQGDPSAILNLNAALGQIARGVTR